MTLELNIEKPVIYLKIISVGQENVGMIIFQTFF